MRKNLFLLIVSVILASVLFVSCNTDAEHGLYYQIASSSKASSVKISQFLYADDDTYIFLNDNGINKFEDGKTKEPVKLVPNEEGRIICAAYAKSKNEIFFIDKSSNLYRFNGTEPEKINPGTEYKDLFANGYLIKDDGNGSFSLKRIDSYETAIAVFKSYKAFTSGSYLALVCNNEVKIFNNDAQVSTVELEETQVDISSFLVVGDSFYFTLDNDASVYKSVEGKLKESRKMDRPVTLAFESKGKLYCKSENDFEIFNTADLEEGIEIAIRGWANNIATADIIFATDSLIATSSSGLYKIKLKENTNTALF